MKNAKLTDVNHVGLNRFHAYTGLESALSELPKREDGATYGWQFYAMDTGNLYLFNEKTNAYDLVKSSGGGGGGGDSGKQLDFAFTDSDTWSIAHKLNKRPCVKAVDANNKEIVGTIEYTTANNCVIHFSMPQTGKAYVN